MKAIILTAGLGTRFLPITKVIPKAMFPIVNKPVIQYLVEEVVESGITEIMIVLSPSQEVIEEYFKKDPEFEKELNARGRDKGLKLVQEIAKRVNIQFTVQESALGDGNAILQARKFVAKDDFAVLFGDEIIDGPKPALKQLMALYKEKSTPVICAEVVPDDQIHSYGVIGPESQDGAKIKIAGLVEKPNREDAPSNLGIIGKYVCTNEVMTYLEDANSAIKDGEIRLIDAFRKMLEDKKQLFALKVEGKRFDTGQAKGLLEANIAFTKKMGQ